MRKSKKTVAVIYGGAGYEHDISVRGAEYLMCEIDKERYEPLPVFISRSGEWHFVSDRVLTKTETKSLRALRSAYPGGNGILGRRRFGAIKPYAAIPILHGDFGEDGVVQGALEAAGIPFVGCKTQAGALAADKSFTKAVATALDIPVVPWILITEKNADLPDLLEARDKAENAIGYPMFVKPSSLGSSVGCGAVEERSEFAAAYMRASKLGGGRVLIEKKLTSPRELECAYLGVGDIDVVTPPGEVICPRGFYSYSEKYSGTSASYTVVHAEVEPQVSELAKDYSRRLVCAIGVRHVSRIDFFLSDGVLYLNEINTMPGFTHTSLYPALIEASGISVRDMITKLIEDAASDRRV